MGLFHIIILGFSIILVFTSAISGFMGYSRTDDAQAKNMLLAAGVMSLLAGILLCVSIFLLHRQKSFFGHGSMIFAGVLMLISGILYSVASSRISKTTKTALVSTFSSWGAFLIIAATFVISTFFAKPADIIGMPRIKPQQSPSYGDIGGAAEQLRELQVASGVAPAPATAGLVG